MISRPSSSSLPLIFACVGHAYMHFVTAFFFTIVLALEIDWSMSYHELIGLWTVGALLVGLAALPAGWLSDRWGAAQMMVVFFIGIGLTSILAGLSDGPDSLWPMLAGIGLFAAVYHPVGIPWLIRTAKRDTGLVLATNGIFGSVGIALAAVVAGGLIDLWGWRSAFILPGAIALATGVVLLFLVRRGHMEDRNLAKLSSSSVSRFERHRVFLILLFTMFLGGLIFQLTQTVVPKLFAVRLDGIVHGSTFGVGLLVGVVYLISGLAQLLGGYFADRMSLKIVYLASWVPQILILWLAASAGGVPLIVMTIVVTSLLAGSQPAENMLLARYAPARHHGLAFGVKFVLALGAAPLAIELVAWLQGLTGDFVRVFWLMAASALVSALAVLLLPRHRVSVSTVVPGE